MLGMYQKLSKIIDNQNAAKLSIIISIISWFIVGAVIGIITGEFLSISLLKPVIICGCFFSLFFGLIYEMFIILRT